MRRKNAEEEFRYLIVVGVVKGWPIIRKQYKAVSFFGAMGQDDLLEYAQKQGMLSGDVRWVDTYRLVPVEGDGGGHRVENLEQLFEQDV